MNCNNCGNTLPIDAKFCGKCGTQLQVSTEDTTLISNKNKPDIKCGNCGYVGQAENNRTLWAQILVWLCLFGFWIVTIIYFATIKKYRCPKCKSTFIGVKDKKGNYTEQKTNVLKILIYSIFGVVLIGIVFSIVLASLNTARQKAKEMQKNNTTELTYEVMQEISEKINKALPQMLDSNTRLDSVTGIENGLIYKYTLVNLVVDDLKEKMSLIDITKPKLVNNICTSEYMKIYLKNKAILTYSYYDKNGVHIGDVVVNTGTDCNQ